MLDLCKKVLLILHLILHLQKLKMTLFQITQYNSKFQYVIFTYYNSTDSDPLLCNLSFPVFTYIKVCTLVAGDLKFLFLHKRQLYIDLDIFSSTQSVQSLFE